MNQPSQMNHEVIQSWMANYPAYRQPDRSPARTYQKTVSALWDMHIVPLLAHQNTTGRFAGATLSCPERSCVGYGEMALGALSKSYYNRDAIENILCLEGAIEIRFGQDLEHTVTLERFDMFSLPPMVRHSIKNSGNEIVRLVMVLSGELNSRYAAVFEPVDSELGIAGLDALAVEIGDVRGEPVDLEKMLSRVTRFATLVPYKKALKATAGIPPEATAMLSANSVCPLVVPEGHVGRSRTAPIYGLPGLYISIAECTSGDDGPPSHAHSDTQENFFVLDGSWEFSTGFNKEFTISAKPYDLLAVPPNVMRAFRNTGNGSARLFVIIQGPEKMNDTVSFTKAVGAEVEKRFGTETVYALEQVKMTFDAEERLKS